MLASLLNLTLTFPTPGLPTVLGPQSEAAWEQVPTFHIYITFCLYLYNLLIPHASSAGFLSLLNCPSPVGSQSSVCSSAPP